ncbi:opioid growth factor receptor conserved region-domain-containing protein [Roridomyces roridus]|uniref:Opioid growth factor receptor conserved region-domain-containing protein n=1 Tax=Roridomyces roridus TaxID=1738132 RepID=A0AAD7CDE4_9AGAR|nr:opioid growth factor receptor conserved region-domain-containing protein [Roridomyces roridus]
MSVQNYPVPRDVQNFLNGYPNGEDDETIDDNLKFYSNQLRCRPDNLLIDDLHRKSVCLGSTRLFCRAYCIPDGKEIMIRSSGNMDSYNGLLLLHLGTRFPIREPGMNGQSQVLQPHELTALKEKPEAIERLVTSYKLMLDFYGMRLVSEETGAIDRAHRYRNLVRSGHNYLRISRILKCLSEFGLERMNAPFLLHVLTEQSREQLNNRALIDSMDRWWLNCVRNNEEREWLAGVRQRVRQGEPFTREMYTDALEQRLKTGSFKETNA